MTITVMDNGWISDSFTIGGPPSYTDAIVMPPDQYNALTADQIEAMKQGLLHPVVLVVHLFQLPPIASSSIKQGLIP